MDFSLEPMIGRTPEEIEHLVAPWVEDFIEPIIFSDATKTIAEHRKAGDRILVISASGTHLVKPIAERLGIDEILAIELEVAHGVYSGKTVGTLTTAKARSHGCWIGWTPKRRTWKARASIPIRAMIYRCCCGWITHT
jgi:HAD superfamily phosphoserine phosphatase-like hydrolase